MRRLGIALLVLAFLLGGIRLFTGIVYRTDTPVVAFVVKHRPGLSIERTETPADPLERDTVVDRDEPVLVYGDRYLAAMRAAPVALLVMIAGGALLLARGRRRA